MSPRLHIFLLLPQLCGGNANCVFDALLAGEEVGQATLEEEEAARVYQEGLGGERAVGTEVMWSQLCVVRGLLPTTDFLFFVKRTVKCMPDVAVLYKSASFFFQKSVCSQGSLPALRYRGISLDLRVFLTPNDPCSSRNLDCSSSPCLNPRKGLCRTNTFSSTGTPPCTDCPAGEVSGRGAKVCVPQGTRLTLV